MATDYTPNGGAGPPQVDPAQAQEAQIPLQSFALPVFPPQASNLKGLTLTSDIKLDEYSSLLEQTPPPVPELPLSIQSLTLEVFTMGYPPGFLSALAERLPNLKALIIYNQLFAGTTEGSSEDALTFFEKCADRGLSALHLLDVFSTSGFFAKVGHAFKKSAKGIQFLEVNYTFRHEDDKFLEKIHGMDLLTLIGPDTVTCAFNMSKAEVTDDPQDPANLDKEGKQIDTGARSKKGVVPLDERFGTKLVETLTGESAPTTLKLLDSTLYTTTAPELAHICSKHSGLVVLGATVVMDPMPKSKQTVLDAIRSCPGLEQVEIMVFPSPDLMNEVSNLKSEALKKVAPSGEDMKALRHACPGLSSFKLNIMKTEVLGVVEWTREENSEEWKGGLSEQM